MPFPSPFAAVPDQYERDPGSGLLERFGDWSDRILHKYGQWAANDKKQPSSPLPQAHSQFHTLDTPNANAGVFPYEDFNGIPPDLLQQSPTLEEGDFLRWPTDPTRKEEDEYKKQGPRNEQHLQDMIDSLRGLP